MTRELAIDLLSMIEFDHAECCLNTWYHGIDNDMKEALDIAIKALELTQTGLLKDCESCRAENPNKCEDAVSRLAVKEQMIKYGFHAPDMTVTEFVEDLSSVTPQQKVGHWIDTGSGQECSECGEIQHGYDNFRNFCANCGVKMEGVEEFKDRTEGYDFANWSKADLIDALEDLLSVTQQPCGKHCEEATNNCKFCTDLYKSDTLYQSTSWDGGIGFDYIYLNFCPICGRKLEKEGD